MKTLEQVIERIFRKDIGLSEQGILSRENQALASDIAQAIREEFGEIEFLHRQVEGMRTVLSALATVSILDDNHLWVRAIAKQALKEFKVGGAYE